MTNKTEIEIFEELQQGLKDIDQGWDISPNSLDYAANQAFAKKLADAYELLQQAAGVVDIFAANKPQLKNILSLLCIPYLNATRSTVKLEIIANDADVILSEGFRITDKNGNIWITQEQPTFHLLGDQYSASILAASNEYGAIAADSFAIQLVVDGLYITNGEPAILGRNEPTEEEIREQIQKSAALPSRNSSDSIQAHLYNVTGVINCFIDTNENNYYIDASTRQQVSSGASDALEPHSIVIFVQGGKDDEIANQILLSIVAGISMNKNSNFSFTKVTLNKKTPIVEKTLPDGNIRVIGGNGGDITFFRIKEIEIYIKFTISPKKNQTLAGDLLDNDLKKAIVDYSLGKLAVSDKTAFTVSENIIANFFSEPINVTLAENGYYDDLQVSLDNNSWDNQVVIGYGSIAIIKEDNITINRA